MAEASVARLGITVDSNQAVTGLNRLQGAMGKLKGAVFSLQSAFATLMGALAARSLIKTGEMFQNIQTKILNLTKDQGTANKLFQNTSQYATEVAFSFEDLFKATSKLSPILKNSPEEVDKFLRITGDIAAHMGISAEEASTQMIKMLSAGAGAADRFREDGILSMLGFEAGVSYSAERTKEKLIEAFEDPAFVLQGTAKAMADNYTGVLSMIGDKYTQLMQSFNDGGGQGGFFTAVESLAAGYNAYLDANIGSAKEMFAELGQTVGDSLINGVTTAIIAIGGLMDALNPIFVAAKALAKLAGTILNGFMEGWNLLPPLIKQLGFFGAIILGPKAMIIGGIVTSMIGLIDEIMDAVSAGIEKLAEFSAAAAEYLPDDMGGNALRSLSEGMKGLAVKISPSAEGGAGSYEDKLKGLIDSNSSEGKILGLGSGLLEGIEGALGGDMGFSSDYQSQAEELAESIRLAHENNVQGIKDATEAAKNGAAEVGGKSNETMDAITKGAQGYFENIGFSTENMAEFTGKHLQGMEDAFVNFAMTGKLSFKGLINSMIADLARLMVQQMIMLPLKAALGFAEGGVMTDSGPMQLKKYARGGIANSPQVAVFGEGSQPEAYVPLPDGRTIPVTMDDKKGGGGGGQVINITNHVDARGSGPEVENKIKAAMKESSEKTTANIQNLMRRGRFP